MIVMVKQGSDPQAVRRALTERGLWVQKLEGDERVMLWVEPHSAAVTAQELRDIAGVEAVATAPSCHPCVDAQPPVVQVAGVRVGVNAPPVLMAGPCSVESETQIEEIARRLAPLGVRLLRGGAYKPRSSPYSFQGHGEVALGWLRRAASAHGMGVVTEVMSSEDVGPVAEVADLIQVGSRNMQNYALLRAIGRSGRPALLKRGMAATIEEWLLAGEYCLYHGAAAVIFCERGVRGFDPTTRNLLDLGAVALLAQVHRQPVVVDPSHAAGRRDLVIPLAHAALAAGAAGVLVEVHPEPGVALSDGPQAVSPEALAPLAHAVQRAQREGA